jgi:hypothetical protein
LPCSIVHESYLCNLHMQADMYIYMPADFKWIMLCTIMSGRQLTLLSLDRLCLRHHLGRTPSRGMGSRVTACQTLILQQARILSLHNVDCCLLCHIGSAALALRTCDSFFVSHVIDNVKSAWASLRVLRRPGHSQAIAQHQRTFVKSAMLPVNNARSDLLVH